MATKTGARITKAITKSNTQKQHKMLDNSTITKTTTEALMTKMTMNIEVS
jgi:hypothetical protein